MKGYVEHVISTSNEWSMSIVIFVVLATFYKDFRKLKVEKARVTICDSVFSQSK